MSSFPLDQNGDCIDDIPVDRFNPSANDRRDAAFPQIPSDCCDPSREPKIPPRVGAQYQAELPPLIRQPKHVPYTEVPSDCYDAGDEFGESDIPPRIGEEYQAELPPLIRQPKQVPYSEVGHHSLQDFLIGKPLPLIWRSCPNHAGPQTISESKHPHFKNDTKTDIYGNGEIEPKGKSRFSPAKCCGEGHILVPGLVSDSWSDGEKASFLLALYIFEKNFVEVKKFVETKNMGAILSFFYGEFYDSDVYRRWSEGRKTRSKKCVYGQRIFSGLRQQELLSRLIPRLSEERKSALLEATKAFGEEKMSLAEYVSSLKATVGMSALVEAVGIGTGKQDLTGMAIEPIRSNHTVPIRPEIPAGKACSSLTTSEIVKFLNGDYRLSKARSNDLFWEAVWPRLLARGWHSEQPQNQGYVGGLKHSLVFLVPGVKKFSRRKLVKGRDYFDSISDVLSKVGKEPGLIELENEEGDVNNEREEENTTSARRTEENKNDQPSMQRHCYLQPRIPNRGSTDDIKFTVVDTSLPGGCVRELRSLPSQASITSFHPEGSNVSETSTKSGGKNVSKSSSTPVKNKECKENKKSRKVSKPVLSRKQKKGSVDNTAPAPLSKRCRKLTANDELEKRDAPALENGVSCCESNGNLSTQVSSSCQDKFSSTSSSKGSPCESIEQAQEPLIENPQAREPSKAREPSEAREPQLLIDLNLPQVPPEFENDALLTNEADDQSVKTENPSSSAVEARPEKQEARPEEQAAVNPRRLSTRYRPPTTRALEAVASGYLSVSRRRKRSDTTAPSRAARRPRGGAVSAESPNSNAASQVEEGERGASSSGTHNVPDNDRTGGNEESHLRQ